MRKLALFLFIVSLLPYAHAAYDSSGNALLKECQSAIDMDDKLPMDHNYFAANSCLRYIQGFRDANNFNIASGNPALFCVPEKATLIQLTRVVLKYLKDNPNKLHKNEAFHVYFALKYGFPCN